MGGIACYSDVLTYKGDLYIIGNVINNIHTPGGYDSTPNGWARAGIQLWGEDNIYVVNNTIYNVSAGINTPSYRPTHIYNNIIFNVTEAAGNHIYVQYSTTWVLMNNIFYQNGGPARIKIGSTVYSLPQLKTALGKGQGCLTADPLFVNAAAGDFRLQATSPAVDSAIESSVYATFQGLYGLSIAVGFDKTSRPQGAAYDMGAYEFVTPALDKPPSPGAPKVELLKPDAK
jgi:hypothetical protein